MRKRLLAVVFLLSFSYAQAECSDIAACLVDAEGGDLIAQIKLGATYESGEGVIKDPQIAAKWYQMAAQQDSPLAQYKLGDMYYLGKGVIQNYMAAFKWYKAAAEGGNANAQLILGAMYGDGIGVTQNYLFAHMWLNIAGANGAKGARENRDITATRMAPAQVYEAQILAADWMEDYQERIERERTQAKRIEQERIARERLEKWRIEQKRIESEMTDEERAERKRRAEAEKKRRAAADSVRRKADAAALRQVEIEAGEAMQKVMGDIQSTALLNWIQPPTSTIGLAAILRVNVRPGGEIISARVVKSSGNALFDRSAEIAILKASPLPIPSDPKHYPYIKEFDFRFSPNG